MGLPALGRTTVELFGEITLVAIWRKDTARIGGGKRDFHGANDEN